MAAMSAARPSAPRRPESHLEVGRHAGDADAPPHQDSRARLLLIPSGGGRLVHGGGEETLCANSVVVIPPGLRHALRGGTAFWWTLIRFDPASIQVPAWDISHTIEFRRVFGAVTAVGGARVFTLLPRHFEQASALAGEMAREIRESRPGWRDLSLGHFQHLVILLSRHAGAGFRISADASARVAASIHHIESHYTEEIDSAALAAGCGMSERSFYRLFLQATGESPKRYLKRIRVERAAELLRGTDRTITEIAFEVGFVDSSFFAREFRKLRDYPPSAYRKIWQE